jgi:streptogramin lyase
MLARTLRGLMGILTLLAAPAAAHASCTLAEFPLATGSFIPAHAPLATGPDGNVWFDVITAHGASAIGRITPEGEITEFELPAGTGWLSAMTAGPDGGVWFTATRAWFMGGDQIGRIGPAGAVTLFDLPGLEPGGVTTGPDGNLWVAMGSGPILRVTPAGVVTPFPLPWEQTAPRGITAGPDGALWFTDPLGPRIGRITPAGVATEFPLPPAAAVPESITAGPDGNLWFTVRPGRIGRITPAGAITLVPLAGGDSVQPRQIAAGPDGNLWFTEQTGDGEQVGKIGRITPAGVVSELDLEPAAGLLGGIATGSDGRLWFTNGSIFRLAPSPFADVPVDHWAVDPIVALFGAGVTAGCGGDPLIFCPDAPVTRGQLATLLLRAEAPGAAPPPCEVAPFDDVPCSSPFAGWIAALADRGLTAGCGPRLYCPDRAVSRAEVAVLLVRLVAGPGFVPAPCTAPAFGDVPCSSPFAPWIQELAARGIAAGCGPGRFCPGDVATRAEIAAVLTRAFHLGAC